MPNIILPYTDNPFNESRYLNGLDTQSKQTIDLLKLLLLNQQPQYNYLYLNTASSLIGPELVFNWAVSNYTSRVLLLAIKSYNLLSDPTEQVAGRKNLNSQISQLSKISKGIWVFIGIAGVYDRFNQIGNKPDNKRDWCDELVLGRQVIQAAIRVGNFIPELFHSSSNTNDPLSKQARDFQSKSRWGTFSGAVAALDVASDVLGLIRFASLFYSTGKGKTADDATQHEAWGWLLGSQIAGGLGHILHTASYYTSVTKANQFLTKISEIRQNPAQASNAAADISFNRLEEESTVDDFAHVRETNIDDLFRQPDAYELLTTQRSAAAENFSNRHTFEMELNPISTAANPRENIQLINESDELNELRLGRIKSSAGLDLASSIFAVIAAGLTIGYTATLLRDAQGVQRNALIGEVVIQSVEAALGLAAGIAAFCGFGGATIVLTVISSLISLFSPMAIAAAEAQEKMAQDFRDLSYQYSQYDYTGDSIAADIFSSEAQQSWANVFSPRNVLGVIVSSTESLDDLVAAKISQIEKKYITFTDFWVAGLHSRYLALRGGGSTQTMGAEGSFYAQLASIKNGSNVNEVLAISSFAPDSALATTSGLLGKPISLPNNSAAQYYADRLDSANELSMVTTFNGNQIIDTGSVTPTINLGTAAGSQYVTFPSPLLAPDQVTRMRALSDGKFGSNYTTTLTVTSRNWTFIDGNTNTTIDARLIASRDTGNSNTTSPNTNNPGDYSMLQLGGGNDTVVAGLRSLHIDGDGNAIQVKEAGGLLLFIDPNRNILAQLVDASGAPLVTGNGTVYQYTNGSQVGNQIVISTALAPVMANGIQQRDTDGHLLFTSNGQTVAQLVDSLGQPLQITDGTGALYKNAAGQQVVEYSGSGLKPIYSPYGGTAGYNGVDYSTAFTSDTNKNTIAEFNAWVTAQAALYNAKKTTDPDYQNFITTVASNAPQGLTVTSTGSRAYTVQKAGVGSLYDITTQQQITAVGKRTETIDYDHLALDTRYTSGIDQLTNIDWIKGSNFNDMFSGGTTGGTFIASEGNDIYNGDATTSVDYSAVNYQINVTGTGNTRWVTKSIGNTMIGSDTIIGGGTIVGSSYGDTLTAPATYVPTTTPASPPVYFLNGGAGNDTLVGGVGDGTLMGGSGDDNITGGIGSDQISIGSGNDTVSAGAGDDAIVLSLNRQNINGDSLNGGDGQDTLLLTLDSSDTGTGTNGFAINLAQSTLNVLNNTDATGVSYATQAAQSFTNIETTISSKLDRSNAGTSTRDFAMNLTQNTLNVLGTPDATGVSYAAQAAQSFTNIENIIGSNLDDSITGNNLDNQLFGGAGNDTLSDSAGNNNLAGGDGNDSLLGGSGNDTFWEEVGNTFWNANSTEHNTLDGGSGVDTLSYADINSNWDTILKTQYAKGVIVNLSTGTASSMQGYTAQFTHIENVTGSRFSDTITGDTNDNLLAGYSGQDSLSGGDGNDTLIGGSGNDNIMGGTGNDLILESLDAEFNTIDGGDGIDTLNYNVTQYTTDSNSSRYLTEQNHGVWVDLTQNRAWRYRLGTIFGGAHAGQPDAVFDPTDPTCGIPDIITNIENVAGSQFDDVIVGDTNDNQIWGLGGDNLLYGGSGSDSLYGSDGNDTLQGDLGNDSVSGGAGDDLFYSSLDNQNDTIDGGAHGVGGDTVSYTLPANTSGISSGVSVNLTTGLAQRFGTTQVMGKLWAAPTISVTSFDTLSHIENAIGSDQNDTLVGSSDKNLLSGGWGNDSIDGQDGFDLLIGGAGNDTESGGTGNDVFLESLEKENNILDGGTGSDTVSYTIDPTLDITHTNPALNPLIYTEPDIGVVIDLTLGKAWRQANYTRTLSTTTPDDQLIGIEHATGSLGKDWINGTARATNYVPNIVHGVDQNISSSGNNQLSGGDGNDTLLGQSGDDTLLGGFGQDSIDGGDGNDYIVGGVGNDILLGGTGNDVFDEQANTPSYAKPLTFATTYMHSLDGGSGSGDLIAFGNPQDLSTQTDSITPHTASPSTALFNQGVTANLTLHTASWTSQYFNKKADDLYDTINYTLTNIEHLQGTDRNDSLTGDNNNNALLGGAGNDTLVGATGNDDLYGGSGNDLYIFNLGDGSDTLYENDHTAGNTDVLKINANSNQLWFTRDSVDLRIFIIGTTDVITIANWYSSTNITHDNSIEQIQTADGKVILDTNVLNLVRAMDGQARPYIGTTTIGATYWSAQNNLTGDNYANWIAATTSTNTYLNGLSGDDTLIGNTGNDFLVGGAGSDSLIGGVGQDTLIGGTGNDRFTLLLDNDSVDGGAGTDDFVEYSQIKNTDSIEQSQGLSINLTQQKANWRDRNGVAYQAARFDTFTNIEDASGSNLDDALIGNSSSNVLSGGASDDVLDGMGGQDALLGGTGDDTYLFGKGSGQVIITDEDILSGSQDVLKFKSGVTAADLWFTQTGNTLQINILGTSDMVLIVNWYSTEDPTHSYRIETIQLDDGHTITDSTVDALVSALALQPQPTLNTTTQVLQFANAQTAAITSQIAQNYWTQGDPATRTEILGTDQLSQNYKDVLEGGDYYDVLTGGLGDDTLNGGLGNDVYTFARGDGNDLIFDKDSHPNIDTLQLGAGITTGQLWFSRVNDDLEIDIIGVSDPLLTDSITIKNYYLGKKYHIEQIKTDDGSVLNEDGINAFVNIMATLTAPIATDQALSTQNQSALAPLAARWVVNTSNQTLTGTVNADVLIGANGNDTLWGKQGNDVLIGRHGNDLYLFNAGDGSDLLEENDSTPGAVDTLQFGANIGFQNLYLSHVNDAGEFDLNGNNLKIDILNTQDSVTIEHGYLGGAFQIEKILAGDGSTLFDSTNPSLGTVTAQLAQFNQRIINAQGAQAIQSRPSVNNTYSWDGTASVIIDDYDTLVGNVDTLNIDNGSAGIWLTQNNNDLNITLGSNTTNILTIRNWFLGYAYHIENISGNWAPLYGGYGGSVSDILCDFNVPYYLTANTGIKQNTAVTGVSALINTTQKSLSGGAAQDTLYARNTEGNSSLSGNDENDFLVGNTGNDTLSGGNGSDTLDGGAGQDVLFGDGGNDTFIMHLDNDTAIGSGTSQESDTVTYQNITDASSTIGLTINLSTGKANWSNRNNAPYLPGSYDTLQNIEYAIGTHLDDQITGDGNDNNLIGGDGNDTLIGNGGNDSLLGSAGNDLYVINLGGGHDIITESGNTLDSADVLQINGVVRTQLWFTQQGNDLLIEILGTNTPLDPYNQSVTIANWFTSTTPPIDSIVLSNGDTLTSTGINAIITAMRGLEYPNALVTQIPWVNQTQLIPILNANWSLAPVAPSLVASTGNDSLTGTSAADTLNGLAGDDTLSGGPGNDSVQGYLGDDVILARLDGDNIDGGDGADTVDYSGITQTSGTVFINLAQQQAAWSGGSTTQYDILYNIENIIGSGGADSITGSIGSNVLYGGLGDDTLTGGAGSDTLFGGSGNDQYIFNSGDGIDFVVEPTGLGTGAEVLKFTGSTLNQLAFKRDVSNPNNLIITTQTTGDSVTLKNWFLGPQYQIETIQATDASYTNTQINEKAKVEVTGSYGTNVLRGTPYEDLFVSTTKYDNAYTWNGTSNLTITDMDPTGKGYDSLQIDLSAAAVTISGYIREVDAGGYYNENFSYVQYPGVYLDRNGDDLLVRVLKPTNLTDSSNFYVEKYTTFNVTGISGGNNYIHGVLTISNWFLSPQYQIENLIADWNFYDQSPAQSALPSGNVSQYLAGLVGKTLPTSADSWYGYKPASFLSTLTTNLTTSIVVTSPLNNTLVGGLGNDTYEYDTGDGNDVILDNDSTPGNMDTITLQAGVGTNPNTVLWSQVGNDLKMGFSGNTTDSLTIANWFSANQDNWIEKILLSNGTVLLDTTSDTFEAQFTALNWVGITNTGTTGNDYLLGGLGNDSLNGGAGNDTFNGFADADTLTGGTGNDSFIGLLGQDSIDGSGAGSDVDTVDYSDISNVANGTILIVNLSNSWPLAILSSDATRYDVLTNIENVIGASLLSNQLTGSSLNNDLVGATGNDTLMGATGNDTLEGDEGNDTYVFNPGDGQDVIVESSGTDTLSITGNVTRTQIWLTQNNSDLVVEILGSGSSNDTITVRNWFLGAPYQLESLVLANGDMLTAQEINTLSEAMNTLVHPAAGFTQIPSLYQATLLPLINSLWSTATVVQPNINLGNNQTYTLNLGDGALGFSDNSGTATGIDTLKLGAGITTDLIWFTKKGNDLVINVLGTTDSYTISNWSTGKAWHIEQIKTSDGRTLLDINVDALASAMTPLSIPPTGQTIATAYPTLWQTVQISWTASTNLTGNADNNVVEITATDLVSNIALASTVHGADGNDTLIGGAANDQLFGDAGDDLLSDTNGSNTLSGGLGNDRFLQTLGSNLLQGDDGVDTVDYSSMTFVAPDRTADGNKGIVADLNARTVTWQNRNNVAYRPTDRDSLIGIENIVGTAQDDQFIGASNVNNTFVGGLGNDTYVFNRGGAQDTLVEYDTTPGNNDVLQLSSANGVINQSDLIFNNVNGDLRIGIQSAGAATTDSITIAGWFLGAAYQVEQVVTNNGTLSANTINGLITPSIPPVTPLPYCFTGSNRSDVISVAASYYPNGAGIDTLIGGLGNDTYTFSVVDGVANRINDMIIDTDSTIGNTDVLKIVAVPTPLSNTPLTVSASNVSFYRSGMDLSVLVTTNFISNKKFFSQGDYVLIKDWYVDNSHHIEQFQLSDGSILFDFNLPEVQQDGLINVPTTAWIQNSTVSGTSNADVIAQTNVTMPGTLSGLAGNDVLVGNTNNDTIIGGAGDDTIIGGSGSDSLSGDDTTGFGNDTFIELAPGGATAGIDGVDSIDGGTGIDTVDYSQTLYLVDGSAWQKGAEYPFPGAASNQLTGLTIDLSKTAQTVVWATTPGTTQTTVDRLSNIEDIIGTNLNDLIIGSSAANDLSGAAGNDILIGGTGNDTLRGGIGGDSYYFTRGDGQDVIDEHDDTLGRNDFLNLSNGKWEVQNGTITYDQLWFKQSGANSNDLEIDILGTATDSITIKNWFFGSAYQIQKIATSDGKVFSAEGITDLVAAMLQLGAPSSTQTNLSTTQHASLDPLLSSVLGGITLTGASTNDSLFGGDGNDTLTGGTGNDVLSGGLGNDTYQYNRGDGQEVLQENDATPGNIDLIQLAVGKTGTQAINWAQLYFTQSGNNLNIGLNSTGTSTLFTVTNWFLGAQYRVEQIQTSDKTIQLNSTGLASQQTFTAATFAQYQGLTSAWSDLFGSVSVTSTATGNNSLLGGSGNDNLTGGIGNDTLNGAAGADTMAGGSGNDVYYIDNPLDQIVEGASAGIDTIMSSITYQLGNNFEILTLTGTAAINGTGTGLNNILTGNSAANQLDGGAGNDTLIGGAGNDTYVVDNAADVVTEIANEGMDTVLSSINYTLGANLENLTLTGSGNISGTGNALNNILIGNSGANQLTGGAGNDTYVVNNTGDVVTENASEGIDTVQSSISYTLGANVENLTLTDGSALSATGNGLDNIIIDNGVAGNFLTGGLGNDTLKGGAGGNFYFFNRNDGNDLIVINPLSNTNNSLLLGYGNTGANAINSTQLWFGQSGNNLVIYVLGSTDTITITDWFNPSAPRYLTQVTTSDGVTFSQNQITAFAIAAGSLPVVNLANFVATSRDQLAAYQPFITWYSNTIGGVTLTGVSGPDSITGGLGNDTYVVDNTNDVVVESINGGTDTVSSSANYTLGTYLENLTLTGANPISGTGNTLNNFITGNHADNSLTGGIGNDTLVGRLGNDTYYFNRNDGKDLIIDNDVSGNNDVLQLGFRQTGSNAINFDQLWFKQVGSNLELDILGTNDSITVKDWFSSTLNQLEQIKTSDGKILNAADVSPLVTYMQSITPPAGSIVFNASTFNSYQNLTNIFSTAWGGVNVVATTGNDLINGGNGNDTLTGGAGNDTLKGGFGRDNYVFNRGDGKDVIAEYTPSTTDTNTGVLSLAPGQTGAAAINYDQLWFKQVGSNLEIDVLGSTDSVTVSSWFDNTAPHYLNQVVTSDGKIYSAALINQWVAAAAGLPATNIANFVATYTNPIIPYQNLITLWSNTWGGVSVTGMSYAEPIGGGTGNDSLNGNGGNDLYQFNRGSGQDTITDNDTTPGNNDVLQFGSSITYDQLWFAQVAGTNNLKINVLGSTDSVTVTNWFGGPRYQIEQIKTSDGRILSNANVGSLVTAMSTLSVPTTPSILNSSTFNTYKSLIAPLSNVWGGVNVTATAGNDSIVGGSGNDTLSGGTGSDAYSFNRGNGKDTIIETNGTGAGLDTLLFAAGQAGTTNAINFDQLWFKHGVNPADLEIDVLGTQDSVTLQNWFANPGQYLVEQIKTSDNRTLYLPNFTGNVMQLVNVMAQIQQPVLGTTSLSQQQHAILDPLLYATWR